MDLLHFKAPYYAVIFTSTLEVVDEEYKKTNAALLEIAKGLDGFLGEESVRDNLGISVSYWKSLEAIEQWRDNLEHKKAKEKGRAFWYSKYTIKICKVEHSYQFIK